MSKIEQLIQQHCPDGVEYKNVKDVISEAFWIMPSTPKFVDNSDIPYITSKNLRKRSIDFTNIKYISNDDYVTISRQRPILENDILIGMIGTIGEIAKVGVFDFKFYGQNMYLLRLDESIIDINFFVHFFDSPFVKSKLNSVKNSSSQGYLKAEHIEKIQIPIPPLAIQKEIATILDKFTALEARSRQYEYYRNQLLAFEGKEVEWKALGELTSLITKGTTPKKYTENGIAFIKTEAFDGSIINTKKLSYIDDETHNKELKRSILKHKDILITIAGATIGKCAIVQEEILPANTNQALAIIRLLENINNKYIFYILKSNHMAKYIEMNVKGSAQPNLNLQQLNDFKIPIPSLEEQERIVNILDQFDALVNDIKTGLPAEIKARRAQYEYYRKKLLTFNRVN